MSIEFLTDSILTTVQDLGRNGFRKFGINPGGAMDKTALRLINVLLGNRENEAILEIHFPAPKILLKKNAVISLGGANFGAKLNENKIENWRPVFVEKGDVLSFPEKIFGNRAYLSVQGGFKIKKWLESGSTNLKAKIGGFEGRKLRKGDELFFRENAFEKRDFHYKISRSLIPNYSFFPTLRVIAGGEYEKLTEESKADFKTRNFTIRNESDRMGFRLKGADLKLNEKFEMVSAAADFGTIQLLPDGQLVVLMADHQTTGGYPRIANIISHDLPLIAQLGANDRLNFAFVSIEEAENLLTEFETELNLLKIGAAYRF